MTEQTAELKYAHAILTLEAELIKLSTRHQSEMKRFINLSQKEFRNPDSIAAERHEKKILNAERQVQVLEELQMQTADALDHLRGTLNGNDPN